MATIRKRRLASGKSVWQCDYRDQHGRRRSKQFDRKRDADAFLVKARGEVAQGLHVADSETGTVQRAYERLIEVLKAESAAPATVDNYEVYYRNHVGPFLGARLLTRIDAVHVQDFLAELRTLGRSDDTLRRVRNVLAAVFDEAMRLRLVAANPVRALRQRRSLRRTAISAASGSRRGRIVIPDPEEVRRMLEVAAREDTAWLIARKEIAPDWFVPLDIREVPASGLRRALKAFRTEHGGDDRQVDHFHPQPWLQPLLAALAFSGIRIGEARGLAWRSVEADALVIEQAADRFNNLGPVKTVAALRRAPVGPVLSRTLADWAARQGQGRAGLVFASETGTPLSHRNVYNRGFVPLLLALGLTDARGRPKFSPHSPRHFAVSLWIAQGADAKQVAQWVGHESAALCWTHATRKGRTDIRYVGQ